MFTSRNSFLYLGIFFITLCTLTYEILLTRILSVLMYYNFVSVVIALALFGMSLSSIYVYINQDNYTPDEIDFKIVKASKLFAFALFFIFLLIVAFRISPEIFERLLSVFQPQEIGIEPLFDNPHVDSFVVFIFCVLFLFIITLPFFISGICLTTIFLYFSKNISKIYFCDLVGAGLGCLLVIPLINIFGVPSSFIIISGLAIFSSICFVFWQNKKESFFSLIILLVLFISLGLFNTKYKWVDLDFVHGKYNKEIFYSGWDALSRVVVYPLEDSEEDVKENIPERMGIAINETGYTAMVEFKKDFSRFDYLTKMINSLVWYIRPEKEVFLIGPGGGEDILAALYFKSKKVTAVEINKLLVDIVDKEFSDFSGSPYSLPNVESHIDNARSFIKTSKDKYDVINASLVYEWFHPAGGAFTLSESNLYTKEAFEDYFAHLKPQGILAISRFSFEARALRLVAIGLEALNKLNVKNPENNIFIADQGGFAAYLFKKEAFTNQELLILKTACDKNNFTVLYMPYMIEKEPSVYLELIKTKNLKKFYDEYPYDISPPIDDKPFFNYMIKPKDLFGSLKKIQIKEVNEKTVYLMRWILILGIALVLILIIVPWLFLARPTIEKKKMIPSLLYFTCIGIAYMLIEISVIRKFSLFLGDPIYSLSIVLFSLFIFSGLGSFLTHKFNDRYKYLKLACICIGLITILLINLEYFLEPLFSIALFYRIMVSIIILAPLGISMGMPLPLGIKLIEQDKKIIPWIFSINGAASVTGSLAAFIIAMNFGFNIVLVIAIILYMAVMFLGKYMGTKCL